jgi:hypothetical protein
MTINLEQKFDEFESQVATQHGELTEALNAILTALGAPPPGPTTTLEDVVTAIEATNTLLTAIHSDMNSYLLSIFNTLDTINNNASLNSQRILNTLLQTACPCDSTVPLLPPDLSTTPTDAANLAKCQRIQYFIDLFAGWVISIGVYVGEMGSISSFQIDNLLAIQIGDAGISTGQLSVPIPTSIRDSIVGQITSAVSAGGAESVNEGLFTAMTNPENLDGMNQSLYAVNNATAGRASFDAMLDSLVGMNEPYLTMIRTMFYSAWLNDIYSDVPVVDASAYDGSVCAPDAIIVGCWSPTEAQLVDVHVTNTLDDRTATYLNAIIWPSEWGTTNTYTGVNPGGDPINIVGDAAFVWLADVFGLWVSMPSGTMYNHNEDPIATGATFTQITEHTTHVFVIDGSTGFQICDVPPLSM